MAGRGDGGMSAEGRALGSARVGKGKEKSGGKEESGVVEGEKGGCVDGGMEGRAEGGGRMEEQVMGRAV